MFWFSREKAKARANAADDLCKAVAPILERLERAEREVAILRNLMEIELAVTPCRPSELDLRLEPLWKRIITVESVANAHNGAIYRHDQTFRALGADAFARANGGGSVAPPASTLTKAKPKKTKR